MPASARDIYNAGASPSIYYSSEMHSYCHIILIQLRAVLPFHDADTPPPPGSRAFSRDRRDFATADTFH